MKICIPSVNNHGADAVISRHFGRSPFFIIIDSETSEAIVMKKPEGNHGQCVPFDALMEHEIEAAICQGLGRGAASKFSGANIPVYITSARRVGDAVTDFREKRLRRVNEADLCAGHGAHHDHRH